MQTVSLRVMPRNQRGKGAAARLRRSGGIPAVFYGRRQQSVPVVVEQSEFLRKIGRMGSAAHLIEFDSDVDEFRGQVALLKEVQRHPVSGTVLHVDFYAVDMTRALRVSVPLEFKGKAAGVALGGILQPVQREIEIECLPADIPETIEIDVSRLGIHDAVHVADIALPPGVRAVYETNYTVVTVLPPTVEEAAKAPEEAIAEAAPIAAEGEAVAEKEKKEEAGEG